MWKDLCHADIEGCEKEEERERGGGGGGVGPLLQLLYV